MRKRNFVLFIFMVLLPLSTERQGTIKNKRTHFLVEFLNSHVQIEQVFVQDCGNYGSRIHFSRVLTDNSFKHTFANNLTFLQHSRLQGPYAVIADQKCVGFSSFLKEQFRLLCNELNFCLIWQDELTEFPSNIYFPINSRIFLIKQNGLDYYIHTLYNLLNGSEERLVVNKISRWTENEGLKDLQPNKLSLPRDRLNLNRVPLKVSFYFSYRESLLHATDFKDIQKDNLLKINYILLSALADYLNATFVPIFRSKYGFFFDNVTNLFEYNSTYGDVQRGVADILGVNGFVAHNRLRFFRFFAPTASDTIKFIFMSPPMPSHENVYFKPFVWESWLCISAIFVAGFVILFAVLIKEQQLCRTSDNVSVIDVIMMVVSAVLQKSWDLSLHSLSGKLSLIVIYFSFLVLFNAYSASIIVFLQGTSESIRSFDDLYRAKFDIAVHNVNYNFYYFLEANERTDEYWRSKIFREIILAKGRTEFFVPLNKGVELIKGGSFAFQSQVSAAHHVMNRFYTEREKCSIRYVNTIYSVGKIYLAMRKNSSYFQHYSVGMRRIFEHGLQQRAFLRTFTTKLPCERHISYYNGIGITEVRFIFLFFISVLLISVVILAFEIFLARFANSLTYFRMLRKLGLIQEFSN